MDDSKKRKLEEEEVLSGLGATGTPSLAVAKQVVSILQPPDLVAILAQAAAAHADVAQMVAEAAGRDDQNRKVFVRGLDPSITTEAIRVHYAAYGLVEEGMVIKDKLTGRSKGFGFVKFTDMLSAMRALEEPTKLIDGHTTTCQLAALGSRPTPVEDVLPRKIYVGNVHQDIPAERIREFFSQFGEIEEGPIGFDRESKRSRGYALFLYRTAEGAQAALREPVKVLDGHQLHCKLAGDPKGKLAAQRQQGAVLVQYPQVQHPQQPRHQQQLQQQPALLSYQPPPAQLPADSMAYQGLLSQYPQQPQPVQAYGYAPQGQAGMYQPAATAYASAPAPPYAGVPQYSMAPVQGQAPAPVYAAAPQQPLLNALPGQPQHASTAGAYYAPATGAAGGAGVAPAGQPAGYAVAPAAGAPQQPQYPGGQMPGPTGTQVVGAQGYSQPGQQPGGGGYYASK